MEFTSYIESELYILVPVLYAMGTLFKKTSVVEDKWIPIILGTLGIVLASAYKLATYSPSNGMEIVSLLFAGVTQGILCAAGSVYANNIIKQMKKGSDDESSDESNSENDNDVR